MNKFFFSLTFLLSAVMFADPSTDNLDEEYVTDCELTYTEDDLVDDSYDDTSDDYDDSGMLGALVDTDTTYTN